MRHTRARRRFKLTLAVVFALCLVFFLEDKIGAFAPQLKNYAEMKIEGALGGKTRFSIGSIEGGIFSPITLSNIKLSDRKGGPFFSSFDIPVVKTNYRVWDLLAGNRNKTILSMILFGDSYIDVNFIVANRDISGFIRFGASKDGALTFKGYAKFFGKNKVDFSGVVRDEYLDMEARPSSGTVRARIYVNEDNSIRADIDVEHIKLYGFDIVCKGAISNTFSPGYSEGELKTDKMILNYSPFLGMSAKYRASGSSFELVSLDMDDAFKASGRILFGDPHYIDITVLANNVNLNWLMPILGARDATDILSGTMNGKFVLKGPIDDIKSEVRLEMRNGNMSTLDFDFLSANFKGDGPLLKIEDSKITRESGYFSLAGDIDLSKIGKPSLFDGIKMASDDRAINWDSLNTRDLQGTKEVHMNKKIMEGLNIDFKKFLKDERIDESSRYEDEVKLEYKLSTNESLKMMVGTNNDFFGVEHRDRF